MPIVVAYTVGSTPWKRTEVISHIELEGFAPGEARLEQATLEQCIQRRLSRYGIHGRLCVTARGPTISIVGNLLMVSRDLERPVGQALHHLEEEIIQVTAPAGQAKIVISCFGNVDSS